jgi:two-component system sensor histidine kinase YesM
MEGKTNGCRIYVRVFDRGSEEAGNEGRNTIVMEVEDTGRGMDEEEVAFLNDRMNNCTIEDIKGGSHVGILNACLRLRMYTDGDAHFEIESEKEVGTYITISVPVWRLSENA